MNNYTLVLLHGYKQTNASLSCFEKRLKKFYKVINITYPQFDENKILNLDDYVSYIHELIKNETNIIFIGHSLGGKIATLYALKYEVKKIILIAPSTYRKIRFKLKMKLFLNKIIHKFHLKKNYESKEYKVLNQTQKKTFNNMLKNVSKTNLMSSSVNTLIIGFKNDKAVYYKDLKLLNKLIPNSSLHFYKGDHFSYLDYADELTLLILDFINYDI